MMPAKLSTACCTYKSQPSSSVESGIDKLVHGSNDVVAALLQNRYSMSSKLTLL